MYNPFRNPLISPPTFESYLHILRKNDGQAKPLWNTEEEESPHEYVEIEILTDKPEDTYIPLEKSIDEILNMNKYTCHICNILVPIMYMTEHNNSAKHNICYDIASLALRRTIQQIKPDIAAPRKIEAQETYFCGPCAAVVLIADKDKHEAMKMHKISVKHDEMLSELYKIYSDIDNVEVNSEIDEIELLRLRIESEEEPEQLNPETALPSDKPDKDVKVSRNEVSTLFKTQLRSTLESEINALAGLVENINETLQKSGVWHEKVNCTKKNIKEINKKKRADDLLKKLPALQTPGTPSNKTSKKCQIHKTNALTGENETKTAVNNNGARKNKINSSEAKKKSGSLSNDRKQSSRVDKKNNESVKKDSVPTSDNESRCKADTFQTYLENKIKDFNDLINDITNKNNAFIAKLFDKDFTLDTLNNNSTETENCQNKAIEKFVTGNKKQTLTKKLKDNAEQTQSIKLNNNTKFVKVYDNVEYNIDKEIESMSNNNSQKNSSGSSEREQDTEMPIEFRDAASSVEIKDGFVETTNPKSLVQMDNTDFVDDKVTPMVVEPDFEKLEQSYNNFKCIDKKLEMIMAKYFDSTRTVDALKDIAQENSKTKDYKKSNENTEQKSKKVKRKNKAKKKHGTREQNENEMKAKNQTNSKGEQLGVPEHFNDDEANKKQWLCSSTEQTKENNIENCKKKKTKKQKKNNVEQNTKEQAVASTNQPKESQAPSFTIVYYLKDISRRCLTQPIHTVEAITDAIVQITAINGDIIRVPTNNFHSFHVTGNDFCCKVCESLNVGRPDWHIVENEHRVKIMIPIYDMNGIRQLNNIWSHCILCNDLTNNIELHRETALHKINTMDCLIEPSGKDTSKPSAH